MSRYYKTNLGQQILKQRQSFLTAKQRRLLLLIGSSEFDLLTPQIKERFAPNDLIKQLLDLGLIIEDVSSTESNSDSVVTFTHQHKNNSAVLLGRFLQRSEMLLHSLFPTKAHSPSNKVVTQPLDPSPLQDQNQAPSDELQHFDELNFSDVQILMMHTLEQHCGLMAKQLIHSIQKANNQQELKQCQIQWLTALQETRIPTQELNHMLKQINLSLDKEKCIMI